MDCREIRANLAAYHDGELAPADRARVEAHLGGCGECAAILARLAAIDADVDVPDPGPGYWERFNRRVMDRLEKDAAVPGTVLRPKRGWARRQLPYFIPAVAAAALLLVVVRQTGMDPFSRTASPPPALQSAPQTFPKAEGPGAPPAAPSPKAKIAARRAAPKESPSAVLTDEGGRYDASAAGGPPSVAGERAAAETGLSKELSSRGLEEAPPAPQSAGVTAETTAPREREEKGIAAGKADRAVPKPMASAAPAAAPSPCEAARSLAGRGRLKEAETAQRACLARETSPAVQESGMVFLAELLDRQSRFAEADAVLRETQRQFPESRPVDAYLRQRSQVQNLGIPAKR
ncbi:MAG: Anti-sigma factor [Deltaproteobacteria bacterium]|nr:Anti-sigma factor [Deltaproteobacteria bacterium]